MEVVASVSLKVTQDTANNDINKNITYLTFPTKEYFRVHILSFHSISVAVALAALFSLSDSLRTILCVV